MSTILFICGKARKRSPTAAAVAAEEFGLQTDFAGLSADADERVTPEHLAWADTIAVMEKAQLARLKRQMASHLKGKRLVCLEIPDSFDFMQPELVELLQTRLRRILRSHAALCPPDGTPFLTRQVTGKTGRRAFAARR